MEREKTAKENGGDFDWSPIASSSSSLSSPNSSSGGFTGATNCILHPVSKFDTLAGVAIKYGVEVADVKRANGLVTDLQMFALKTLEIPLPGRHPPSCCLSNGLDSQRSSSFEQSKSHHRHSDLLDSLQSLKLKGSSQMKVSPAMSSLQGYYGLKQADQKTAADGFEMSMYRRGAHYLEDVPFLKTSPIPNNHHRKSSSDIANGLLSRESEDSDSDKWIDNVVRRRQKSEADFTSKTPEMLIKEDSNGSSGFSTITSKGLALRPKSASRTSSGVDAEASGPSQSATTLWDSLVADTVNGVRKSSSTSCLEDTDDKLSSMWPATKWSLKPEFPSLSTAAITRPIFDGLPKPMGRRNKAAVD